MRRRGRGTRSKCIIFPVYKPISDGIRVLGVETITYNRFRYFLMKSLCVLDRLLNCARVRPTALDPVLNGVFIDGTYSIPSAAATAGLTAGAACGSTLPIGQGRGRGG